MKFTYIGGYPEGRSELLCYGYLFSPGVSVDLPEPFASKASNNRFFLKAEPSEAVTLADVTVSVPDLSKADLIAMADKAGVTIDRRWSASRIQQTIIEAANQLSEGP